MPQWLARKGLGRIFPAAAGNYYHNYQVNEVNPVLYPGHGLG
jgi:hypothetical protein